MGCLHVTSAQSAYVFTSEKELIYNVKERYEIQIDNALNL
jgi:hypothetical protein